MPNGYNMNLFILQITMIIILFGVVLWLIRLNRATRLEKRFSKYAVNVIKDE